MQRRESRAALLLRRAGLATLVQQGERVLEASTSSCRAVSSPMQPCVTLLSHAAASAPGAAASSPCRGRHAMAAPHL